MTEQRASRRSLLKAGAGAGLAALVLGGGGFALHSCRGGSGQGAVKGGAHDPYDVWRQVQAALRTSPDHALARAGALGAAGDVEALHRFVRDEIRLVSSSATRLRLGDEVRWGARAALRAGAGTAREKAEILADLIRQTGREARVVEGGDIGHEADRGVFFREYSPVFEPQVKTSQVDQWREALGQPDVKINLAAGERQAQKLERDLRALIPQDEQNRIASTNYSDRIEGAAPIVLFVEPGQGAFLADPIRPDGGLEPTGSRTPRDARPARGILPVTVSLTATVLDETVAPFEIARAEWTAEEVAGRQVRIGFKPFGDTLSVLNARIGDLRAFTPFLSIQALDGEAMDPERALVMGQSFTLEGDRIRQAQTGVVEFNDRPLDASPPSGRAADVAVIEAEADASRYPDMRLLIRPKTADGRIVEGLVASDFRLTDEGEAVVHLLQDRERAPHILFLADASASMPKAFIGEGAWRLGDAMKALINRVETMARAVHPKAMVTVQSTDSRMWRNLLAHVGSSANLIVYATDGDLEGAPPAAAEIEALGAGPRAIVMDVNARLARRREQEGERNIFDAMARATGGVALNVSTEDTDEVEGVIRRFLNEETQQLPYVLTYRGPVAASGVRTAGVAIDKADGEAPYEIGAASAPARKISALHLTVRVGDRQIQRRLAGQDERGVMAPDRQNELHGALLGDHLIAFEGPPPSLSTVLDDLIAARLSTELLDKTARDRSRSLDDIIAVLDKGVMNLPKEQAALLMRSAPLSGRGFAFAEQGMRVVLHSRYPIVNTDQFASRIDILPLSRAHVIAPDREAQLSRALNASLMLAMGEAALFPINTGAALSGKRLALLSSDLPRQQTPALSADEQVEWAAFMRRLRDMFPSGHVALTADDASTRACWVVDNATGELFAVLPDGSGGGQMTTGMQRQLAELDKVISMLNLLVTATSAAGGLGVLGGASLAIVAAYGQTLARLYAAASMSVLMTDSGGMDPIVRQALAGLACNVVKTFFLSGLSVGGRVAANAVNIFSAAEGVDGALGIQSPTFCAV